MDTRIPQLPYIPGPVDTANSYIEIAIPDGSSATGYTSCRAYIDDIASSPSVGVKEVAWGDSLGNITSNPNLTYDSLIYKLGLNYAGSSIFLNNNSITDATTSLSFSRGNINLGEYVGAPTISAIHMNVIPGANNYTLARTAAGQVFLNGDTGISHAINGSVKAIMDGSYTQYLQPVAVGSVTPSGANAFVVSGESFLKGAGTSSGTYQLRTQNSSGSPIFSLRDDKLIQINTSSLSYGNLITAVAKDATNDSFVYRDSSDSYNIFKIKGDGYTSIRALNMEAPIYPIINFNNAYNSYTIEHGLYDFYIKEGSSEKIYLASGGNVGLSNVNPTSRLDIDGANGYTQLRLRQNYTPSSTADVNGNTGDVSWDASYFYLKTAPGAWGRVAWDFAF